MKTRAKNFRQSGHYFTPARMVAASMQAAAQGNLMLQQQLLGKVGRLLQGGLTPLSQRQVRKARRQRWAAGDRRAFN